MTTKKSKICLHHQQNKAFGHFLLLVLRPGLTAGSAEDDGWLRPGKKNTEFVRFCERDVLCYDFPSADESALDDLAPNPSKSAGEH